MSNFTPLYNLGFSVFPLPYKSKNPNLKWKQYQLDRPSVLQCAKWDGGQHNIAIVTGQVSGVFVVDVDGESGRKTLEELQKNYGKLPETVSAITGRGIHLYFRYPDSCPDISNLSGSSVHGEVLTGIDVRGNGGYVVAPPSLHPKGDYYRWERSPFEFDIAEAPQWLLDLVVRPNETERSTQSAKLDDRRIQELVQEQCTILEDAEEEFILKISLEY